VSQSDLTGFLVYSAHTSGDWLAWAWAQLAAGASDIGHWNTGVIAGLISVSGTICVSYVLFLGNRREARWAATMALFAEFNAFAMSNARSQARVFLASHFDKNYDEISRLPRSPEASDEERTAHLAVMRFYERLSVLRRNERLIDRTLFDLFAPIFATWWAFSYSTQLAPTDWQAAQEIEMLRAWMEKQAAKKGRMDDWNRALRSGQRERGAHGLGTGDDPVPVPALNLADFRRG
jgi:hypothetical protein